MSLRKSPVRTPALLAANRANAAQSTGPRTVAGKRRSAWNAFRHGYRSRAAWAGEPQDAGDREAFQAFLSALRVAAITLPNEAGERALRENAIPLWKAKRILDRWLEQHSWPPAQDDGIRPPFQTLLLHRPGTASSADWWIRISVTVREGRSPNRRARRRGRRAIGRAEAAWRWQKRRAHTVVSVRCTGHPWTLAHHQRIPTNPECHRRGQVWKNVIEDFESQGPGLGPRDFGIMPRPERTADKDSGTSNWWSAIKNRLRALLPVFRARRPRTRIPDPVANEAGMLQIGQDLQKRGTAPNHQVPRPKASGCIYQSMRTARPEESETGPD